MPEMPASIDAVHPPVPASTSARDAERSPAALAEECGRLRGLVQSQEAQLDAYQSGIASLESRLESARSSASRRAFACLAIAAIGVVVYLLARISHADQLQQMQRDQERQARQLQQEQARTIAEEVEEQVQARVAQDRKHLETGLAALKTQLDETRSAHAEELARLNDDRRMAIERQEKMLRALFAKDLKRYDEHIQKLTAEKHELEQSLRTANQILRDRIKEMKAEMETLRQIAAGVGDSALPSRVGPEGEVGSMWRRPPGATVPERGGEVSPGPSLPPPGAPRGGASESGPNRAPTAPPSAALSEEPFAPSSADLAAPELGAEVDGVAEALPDPTLTPELLPERTPELAPSGPEAPVAGPPDTDRTTPRPPTAPPPPAGSGASETPEADPYDPLPIPGL